MPKSPYVIVEADGTLCPTCGQQPRLLMREDGEIGKMSTPAFYICSCGFVGHVGVGPVTKAEAQDLADEQAERRLQKR